MKMKNVENLLDNQTNLADEDVFLTVLFIITRTPYKTGAFVHVM